MLRDDPGLYYCDACKGQFTATKRWLAVFMLSSSNKGISTHQLHRFTQA